MDLTTNEGGAEVAIHHGIALHRGCGVVFLASPTFVASVAPFPTVGAFGACFVDMTLHCTFFTFIFPGWALVSSCPNCIRAVGWAKACLAISSASGTSRWCVDLSHASCHFTAHFALLLFGLLLPRDVFNHLEQGHVGPAFTEQVCQDLLVG